MSLKDDMLSDLDVFYDDDDFAHEVTFMPKGDPSVITKALILIGQDLKTVSSGFMQGQYAEAFISLRRDQVGKPNNGDKILFDGYEWIIRSTPDHANILSYWCEMTRGERANIT